MENFDKNIYDENFFEKCRTCRHCYTKKDDADMVYCRKRNGKCEYNPAKGYRDGLLQGKLTLARELSHIINLHLNISLKNPNNKVSEKALEKFSYLLDEETYKQ